MVKLPASRQTYSWNAPSSWCKWLVGLRELVPSPEQYCSVPERHAVQRQQMREANRMPTRAPRRIEGSWVGRPGPRATRRAVPSWPPLCGSLIDVMGEPSALEALPAAVWRSGGC